MLFLNALHGTSYIHRHGIVLSNFPVSFETPAPSILSGHWLSSLSRSLSRPVPLRPSGSPPLSLSIRTFMATMYIRIRSSSIRTLTTLRTASFTTLQTRSMARTGSSRDDGLKPPSVCTYLLSEIHGAMPVSRHTYQIRPGHFVCYPLSLSRYVHTCCLSLRVVDALPARHITLTNLRPLRFISEELPWVASTTESIRQLARRSGRFLPLPVLPDRTVPPLFPGLVCCSGRSRAHRHVLVALLAKPFTFRCVPVGREREWGLVGRDGKGRKPEEKKHKKPGQTRAKNPCQGR